MDNRHHNNQPKLTGMKKVYFIMIVLVALGLPALSFTQSRKARKEAAAKEAAAKDAASKTDTAVVPAKDTSAPAAAAAVAVIDTVPKVDTVVIAAAPPKDCFQEWYEKFRTRGALKVTDGIQPVIITLKSESGSVCMMGQVEVVGGKIKLPLLVQQEDGQFKPFTTTGKKLDPAFVSTMSDDQLLAITDGMSVTFRTSTNEYGRLIFYTFANKAAKVNKVAPSPDELLKEQ